MKRPCLCAQVPTRVPEPSTHLARSVTTRSLVIMVGLAILLVPTASWAELCAVDDVPAATLLVPYFEVDLNDCGSSNTLVTVINTVPETTLVAVTLWTDWGQPTIAFHLYLTGFDVETLDLGAAFCDGSLPVTGPTVSNHGELSDPPGAPPDCEIIFPFPDPVIIDSLFDRLRNGHTGGAHFTFDDRCAGSDYGDGVARGWITLDVVTDCQLLLPTEPEYFDFIGFDNRLLGEVTYIEPTRTLGMPAVHLEAAADGSTFLPGDHTFYGRLVSAQAIDRREPLPTTYGMPIMTMGATMGDLVVWREHFGETTAVCGTNPAGIPLAQNDVLAFDHEENPRVLDPSLGLMTQTLPTFPFFPEFGWAFFDEGHDGGQALYGDDLAQAWVGHREVLGGSLSWTGGPAAALESACSGAETVIPIVFADGFESGDTSAWSAVIP